MFGFCDGTETLIDIKPRGYFNFLRLDAPPLVLPHSRSFLRAYSLYIYYARRYMRAVHALRTLLHSEDGRYLPPPRGFYLAYITNARRGILFFLVSFLSRFHAALTRPVVKNTLRTTPTSIRRFQAVDSFRNFFYGDVSEQTIRVFRRISTVLD